MMTRSFACDGLGADFYWHYHSGANHITAACNALMNTLGQDRLKNPYLEASNRGEFVHRLRAASKGQLREPEDMKPVQRRIPGASLFELRWQGIESTG